MHISTIKTQESNKKIFIVLLISLFIFPQELRSVFGEKIYTINILGMVSLLLLVLNNFREIDKKKLILLYTTVLIYMCSAIFYENKITTVITTMTLFIIPLSLTIIKVDKHTLRDILKWIIWILNSIIIVITAIGILEMTFDLNINIAISKFMSQRTQELMLLNSFMGDNKRLYSFMGHPLFNTQLYLMFFILNTVYSKYFKRESLPIWVLIVSVIGIAFTGSKAGFVILCLAIAALFKSNSRMKKILVVACGMIIAFKLGLFDNLISRFTAGSLTTGRNEKWLEIQSMDLFPIKFFTGYGRGFTFQFNSYVDWASAAFEYPARMFSLEFGVMVTALIYTFIMVIPTIILLARRHYYLFISYLIVFLDVNTFNGLSTTGDKMLIFCLFVFLILNLSNSMQERELVSD